MTLVSHLNEIRSIAGLVVSNLFLGNREMSNYF